MLVREKYPDTDVHVFYIDVRTPGKNFDEFQRRAVEQYDVDYIKGMVGKIAEENGKLKVQGSDLINGEQILIDADLVVLATAIEPDDSARSIASMLTASTVSYTHLNNCSGDAGRRKAKHQMARDDP